MLLQKVCLEYDKLAIWCREHAKRNEDRRFILNYYILIRATGNKLLYCHLIYCHVWIFKGPDNAAAFTKWLTRMSRVSGVVSVRASVPESVPAEVGVKEVAGERACQVRGSIPWREQEFGCRSVSRYAHGPDSCFGRRGRFVSGSREVNGVPGQLSIPEVRSGRSGCQGRSAKRVPPLPPTLLVLSTVSGVIYVTYNGVII